MDENAVLAIITSASFIVAESYPKKKKRRRWWIRNFLKKRDSHGAYRSIMTDLKIEDRAGFKNFIRMTPTDFETLLCLVGPIISKEDTKFRNAITPAEKLAVTLRYFATGDSYSSLMYLHRLSKSAISNTIPVVSEALVKVLSDYIKVPSTLTEWLNISQGFEEMWNFPNCLGALDGKHVAIIAPPNQGSTFYNYKGFHSIVLMAIVDAEYRFIFVDIGQPGRIADGGVFTNTHFYRKLVTDTLNIPTPNQLTGTSTELPFVFLADDAFALTKNIMKPYPGLHSLGSQRRAYNYRLSRARRVVENVFGLLSSVFRIFRKPIALTTLNSITSVVLACVYLHNYLRRNRTSAVTYAPTGTFDYEDIDNGDFIPGEWRNHQESFLPLHRIARHPPQEASNVREKFCEYFSSDIGRVPWQNKFA